MAGTPRTPPTDDQSTLARIKRAGISGLALTIPLVVTVLVLVFVWGFLASLVTPFSTTIGNAFDLTSNTQQYVLFALTSLGLATIVVVIGLIANSTPGSRVENAFDDAISAIPGIGAVYASFNEMSEILLDSDNQSFQEVVMVEYPYDGSYCVAFLTAETPAFVRDTVGEDEMITVFMPMGPNPFMGGFPLHISTERIYEIDMTVEEGIRSIVTSGVAMGQDAPTAEATAIEHGGPDAGAAPGRTEAIGGDRPTDGNGATDDSSDDDAGNRSEGT